MTLEYLEIIRGNAGIHSRIDMFLHPNIRTSDDIITVEK